MLSWREGKKKLVWCVLQSCRLIQRLCILFLSSIGSYIIHKHRNTRFFFPHLFSIYRDVLQEPCIYQTSNQSSSFCSALYVFFADDAWKPIVATWVLFLLIPFLGCISRIHMYSVWFFFFPPKQMRSVHIIINITYDYNLYLDNY